MSSLRRLPIGGWRRCVHEAASFESPGEYKAALLLDASASVSWWIRNDPVIFRIPTPVGYFEPDFLYRAREKEGIDLTGILEIKGAIFWNGEGSRPRIQADAACDWVEAVMRAFADQKWRFAAVLEQDAFEASSLEAMLANAQRRYP